MSLFKEAVRPRCTGREIRYFHRALQRWPQQRQFSRSAPAAAAPVTGAAEAEVESARNYCTDLLRYDMSYTSSSILSINLPLENGEG